MDEQNLDVVRRCYDAFGRGDLDALLSLLDEAVEWTTPGPPELATAGKRNGRQEVAQFFAALDGVVEMQRFEPKTFLARGDLVVVLGENTAKVKATGKSIDESWAHAFTVKDGRVIRFYEYLDVTAMVAELKPAEART
jgi:uncharacterized protein